MDAAEEAIILAMAANGELDVLIRMARAGQPLPAQRLRALAVMTGVEQSDIESMIRSVLV